MEVVNSGGETMEPFGNGFGDWNMDWTKWRTGSALTGGASDASGGTAEQARLRPESA
ncbi:Ig-like domain-containing protein [Streptomyces violaceorubidus]